MTANFFENQLADLRQDIIEMGGAVEKMLAASLTAIFKRDGELAKEAILMDKDINSREVLIVNQAILLIATHQPVARDLRFLAASLRMASELERVGDLAANLARRAQKLVSLSWADPLPDGLEEMAGLAKDMLGWSLDSFAKHDLDLAAKVLESDDQVDDFNRDLRAAMTERIAKDGKLIYWGLELILLASHLERLGDHATNLSEEVIYLTSGRNVRHGHQVWERERESKL